MTKKYYNTEVYEFKELSDEAKDYAIKNLLVDSDVSAENYEYLNKSVKLYELFQEHVDIILPGAVLHNNYIDKNLKIRVLELEWYSKDGNILNLFFKSFPQIKNKIINNIGDMTFEDICKLFEGTSIYYECNYSGTQSIVISNNEYAEVYDLPNTYLIVEREIYASEDIIFATIKELEEGLTNILTNELNKIKNNSFDDSLIIGCNYYYYENGEPATYLDDEEVK